MHQEYDDGAGKRKVRANNRWMPLGMGMVREEWERNIPRIKEIWMWRRRAKTTERGTEMVSRH